MSTLTLHHPPPLPPPPPPPPEHYASDQCPEAMNCAESSYREDPGNLTSYIFYVKIYWQHFKIEKRCLVSLLY